MNAITVSVDQLRGMIGLLVKHDGRRCLMVEVLEDGPSLVLQSLDPETTIQPDQHGEAHRKVPRVFTVAVLSEDQLEFSSIFLNLEPLDA